MENSVFLQRLSLQREGRSLLQLMEKHVDAGSLFCEGKFVTVEAVWLCCSTFFQCWRSFCNTRLRLWRVEDVPFKQRASPVIPGTHYERDSNKAFVSRVAVEWETKLWHSGSLNAGEEGLPYSCGCGALQTKGSHEALLWVS